jgi:hypothetical protein
LGQTRPKGHFSAMAVVPNFIQMAWTAGTCLSRTKPRD